MSGVSVVTPETLQGVSRRQDQRDAGLVSGCLSLFSDSVVPCAKNLVHIFLPLSCGLLFFGMLSSCDSGRTPASFSDWEAQRHLEDLMNLKEGEPRAVVVKRFLELNISREQKIKVVKLLSNSDDLLALEVLIEIAVQGGESDLRNAAHDTLFNRAARQGLLLTLESMRLWLPVLAVDYPRTLYKSSLSLLDRSLPQEARLTALRSLYKVNSLLGLRLSGALGFDLMQLPSFQPLFAEFVRDSLALQDLPEHSSLALLVVHPQLRKMFHDEVQYNSSNLSQSEIFWVLEQLAYQHSPLFQTIVQQLQSEQIENPAQRKFLKILRSDDSILKQDVSLSLLRGVYGKIQLQDLTVIGRWIDRRAEVALLAIVASEKNPLISTKAYEMLFGKSISTEPLATLLAWIRKHRWEERDKYKELVGVVGNRDIVGEEQVKAAFKKIRDELNATTLLDALLRVSDALLISLFVDDFEKEMSLGRRLALLSHRNDSVRALGVRSLAGCSDVGALKILRDSYLGEKSQTVIGEYEAVFPEFPNNGSQHIFDEL